MTFFFSFFLTFNFFLMPPAFCLASFVVAAAPSAFVFLSLIFLSSAIELFHTS